MCWERHREREQRGIKTNKPTEWNRYIHTHTHHTIAGFRARSSILVWWACGRCAYSSLSILFIWLECFKRVKDPMTNLWQHLFLLYSICVNSIFSMQETLHEDGLFSDAIVHLTPFSPQSNLSRSVAIPSSTVFFRFRVFLFVSKVLFFSFFMRSSAHFKNRYLTNWVLFGKPWNIIRI